MDFGKIATKGQKHIPTTAWNAMREVAQQFENGLPSFESTSANRNPFLVTIENATGASIEPFAVLEISDAMFPNRTGTDFLNEAINRGVELKGIKPSGEQEKNIAITLDGGPNGTLVQAVVVGAVPCKVMVETSSAENYKYAVPVANQTGYLKAAESGNIRILWKESGYGTAKWAYVLLDLSGGENPKITPYLNEHSDEYPDGASRLSSLDTYLYYSSIDKINKKGDNSPPYVYNPLGFPLDRPTVLAKVDGFPGDVQEPTSGNRHIGELVAISSDTRDYFKVNPAGANWSGMNSNPDENGSPNDYFAKGNLYYIQEPNTAEGRYTVIEGSFTSGFGGLRLAVCQRDMPENWTTQFRMPYYPLEMNYGCKPNVSTTTGETFTERCGVYPGDNKLSNKRLDYHYSNGRYSYEPIFTFTGRAKGTVGSRLVYIEIEGNDYLCGTMQGGSSASLSVPWGCYPPDIYPGDMITVQVDAREMNPVITILQCPRDYPENAEIIANSYAVYGQRGWTDVTSEYTTQLGNNGVLVLGTGVSGINAHYSGDSTGAQIPQLYFIELGFRIWRKNKTNAII